MPALAQRWARRTRQLTALVAEAAVVVAGRAGAGVLARLGADLPDHGAAGVDGVAAAG